MNLPLELYPIIFRNLSLKDLGTMSRTCTCYNNIINMFDWEVYLKYNNNLINNENIDINFMKEQGKYLINVKDPDIINSWKTLYPYVQILINVLNGDYTQVNNPNILKDYFKTQSTLYELTFELSCYDHIKNGYITLINISPNKQAFYCINDEHLNYRCNNITDIETFVKKVLCSMNNDYCRLQIDDHLFFVVEL